MATPRHVGGYCWRQSLARAEQSNQAARTAVRRILDEKPGPALLAFYVAEVAQALGENLAALHELRDIGAREPKAEEEGREATE